VQPKKLNNGGVEMKRLLLVVAALTLGLTVQAKADTINFEDQPAGQANFSSTQTVTDGIATFTGGELLTAETCSGTCDETNVYATAFFGGGDTNPITITFSQAVSDLSIQLVNNFPNSFAYSLMDNNGNTSTQSFAADATDGFLTLTNGGITSVTITGLSDSTGDVDPSWDFAIDNLTFTTATNTPEPSSLFLLGTGLLGLGIMAFRRKHMSQSSGSPLLP
jgi:hypothetical protein